MAKAAAKKAPVTVAESREEKLKALNTAVSHIEKDFGKGTVMKLSDNANMEVQAVHTDRKSVV